MDMYLFHLISTIGGLVDLGNSGRIYFWLVERVSGFFGFGLTYLGGIGCSEWPRLTVLDNRWILYTTATVVGSTASFYVSRTVLSKFVKRLMEHDKRFAALSLTLKYDGLKLLCMIRLCPLPYSICNGAVSTFPTVQPLMYGLATAIICPKLLVPAFIGSRLRLLSEKGEEMSAGSKAINIISIIVTVCIGIFTGYYIYNR
jgi:uncharacterized membrane protein YdjX (TVP38/TMEM64 family)